MSRKRKELLEARIKEIQLIVFQSSIDLEKERKDSEKSLKYKQKRILVPQFMMSASM